jgi:deoxyribonuclease IV
MRFGAHVSAAGGLWKAGKAGKELGCEVIQIFSRSPQAFAAKPITDEDAEKFKASMKENDIKDVYIHAPYIINLASGKNTTRFGSVKILRDELERGTQIGAKAIMFHPGSAKEVGREAGIEMVTKGLDRIMDGYTGSCQLLIEISAGAGEVMGDKFEEIAAFINGTERGKEIGVCFDTQHAFASGYDLRTKEAVDATFEVFDKSLQRFKSRIRCPQRPSPAPRLRLHWRRRLQIHRRTPQTPTHRPHSRNTIHRRRRKRKS